MDSSAGTLGRRGPKGSVGMRRQRSLEWRQERGYSSSEEDIATRPTVDSHVFASLLAQAQQEYQCIDRNYRSDDTEDAVTTDNPTTPFPTPPPTVLSPRSPLPMHRQASPFPLENTNARRIIYATPQDRLRGNNGKPNGEVIYASNKKALSNSTLGRTGRRHRGAGGMTSSSSATSCNSCTDGRNDLSYHGDPQQRICLNNVRYGGSYYEGLKVSNPDEYDINVVLKMPKLATCMITNGETGHIWINVNLDQVKRHQNLKSYWTLTKLLECNYLSVQKTNSWFQGLLDKAVSSLRELLPVDLSSDGPARTLIINNGQFSINLAPAFWFDKELWPGTYKKSDLNKEFLIIPKLIESRPLLWRCSFFEHEKKILHGLENVKGAVRLLKVLRDEQNHLTELKSYYIKTVFLLEIPNARESYSRMSLSGIFLHMLKQLEVSVRSETIPFYWNENLNLLKENPELWQNIANSLKRIHSDIQNDPKKAYEYFKMSPPQTSPSTQLYSNVNSWNRQEPICTPRSMYAASSVQRQHSGGAMLQEEGMSFGQKVALGGGIAVGALALAGMFLSSSNSRSNQN